MFNVDGLTVEQDMGRAERQSPLPIGHPPKDNKQLPTSNQPLATSH